MVKKLILPSLIAFTMIQADTNIEFVTEVSITNLYVSILDRSPREDGLNYWMNSGLSNKEIAASFLEQPETQDRYPNGLSDADLIQNVYQNLFNRTVDTEGFDYWYKELSTNNISRSQFILNVMAGSKGDDEKLLDNKTGVALAYAKSGNTDLVKAKKVLENVTANDGSVINTIQRYSLSLSYTQITADYKLKVINDAKLKLTDPAKAAELKAAEEAALKAKIVADAAAVAKAAADKKSAEEAEKVAADKAAADKKAEEEAAAAASAVVVVAAPSAPADTVVPTITLIGNATIAHEAGTVYTDAGATADDDTDGNITANIVVTGAVTQMGSNILSYNVQDAAGNLAQEVNRTVNVSDTISPTIQILGGGGADKNITVDFEAADVNNTIVEANITDNFDTNLTTLISLMFNGSIMNGKNSLSDINTSNPGIYTLMYTATDDYNNSAEANKTVIVDQNDTTAPFIQLTDGLKIITLNVGDTPYDENITKDRVIATDGKDGDLTSELNITRDSNLTYNDDNSTASYKIHYNVTDKNGNKAIEATRTIKQTIDIEAPSIAINGDSNITIRVGDVYHDRGVLVGDNIDLVKNIDINTTWFTAGNTDNALSNIPLDDANITTAEGNYTIRYSATDKAENTSISIDRNVTILKAFTVEPVSELNTTVNLTLGDPYRYATYLGSDKLATITKTAGTVPTDSNDITTTGGDFNITYALDSDTAITINQRVIVTTP